MKRYPTSGWVQRFLGQNKPLAGVVTLESGLQYKVLREWVGKRPGLSRAVRRSYQGAFINETEFENAYLSEAFELVLSAQISPGVVKSWVVVEVK